MNVIASYEQKIGADVKTHLFISLEAKEWVEVGYPTNSDEVDFDPSIGIKLKYTQTLSLIHKLTHTYAYDLIYGDLPRGACGCVSVFIL